MSKAFPLHWPAGQPRTPSNQRRTSPFSGSFQEILRGLCHELDRLGGINVVISSNLPTRADGMPRSGIHHVEDPGVAVYFMRNNEELCIACDKYILVWANARAIQRTIEAIRGIERWGTTDMVNRAFRGFTALAEKNPQHWREYFDFPAHASVTMADVDSAYRKMLKVFHPDVGGKIEDFEDLNRNRENARKELGAPR